MAARPLPPSLYAETARPPIDAPPLAESRRVSVAVVGAGFTGLSAALHLAERGGGGGAGRRAAGLRAATAGRSIRG